MGRTACTEPQCLYSRAISLLHLWAVRPVQSLSACTVEIYLYSPYGRYSLYSRAMPLLPLWAVRPLQSLNACTVQLYLYSPQCLYSTAIPLLPLWAVRPVQSLSACTTVHFTFFFIRISMLWLLLLMYTDCLRYHRDSAVGITGMLRAGRSWDRIPLGATLSAPIQTGPGAHPASYTMGTGSLSWG